MRVAMLRRVPIFEETLPVVARIRGNGIAKNVRWHMNVDFALRFPPVAADKATPEFAETFLARAYAPRKVAFDAPENVRITAMLLKPVHVFDDGILN